MDTIKKHIRRSVLLITLIPLVILGIVSGVMSYTSAQTLASGSMLEAAKESAQRVKWELEAFKIVAEEAGCNVELADPNISVERKQEIINQKAQQHGLIRGCVIDANGLGSNGTDYSERAYFKAALNGEVTITEPTVAKSTGKVSIIIAAPLWENGVSGSKVIGCIYVIPDENFLNNIMHDIKMTENGFAYMIDKEGYTIADVDPQLVADRENIEAIAAADPKSGYADCAEIHALARSGEEGFRDFMQNGVETFVAFVPVENTNGWSLLIEAPAKDYLSQAYASIRTAFFLVIIAAVTSVFTAGLMGKNIGNPVRLCTERIKSLAEGDLTSPVPEINTKDETKILAEATEFVVKDINNMIGDISYLLSSMANGNFDVQTRVNETEVYRGDFHVLIESVREINRKLSATLSQINVSADQVSTGSDQVSGGAQSLSQGATEQASSIEELAATIHTISTKVSETSERCENGRTLVEETVDYVGGATEKMTSLTDAMQDISTASNEISNIIKAIEDIAFQTNILALNAAVEAARAGEAGKGFAVVADEVRNLASKSAEAAHDTTVLIERSVAAVENGTQIAAETAEAVSNVKEHSEEVKAIVAQIAQASAEQADMINQVTVGIEQISGVVQTNSATAEESAAASEELSGQAQMLKKLVGGFRLRR